MRKNILYTAMALAVAAVCGYNVYLSQTEEKLSELALANVEVLAENVELPDVVVTCSSTNYGKCCKLTLITSTIGTPICWYCKQSGDPNDSCSIFDEAAANA
ncbi:MAG: hypothetical protein IJX44_08080 [Bacteroidaceae bacterium]|nr:hypothetical protein [Bacteroidaceae bacterium]